MTRCTLPINRSRNSGLLSLAIYLVTGSLTLGGQEMIDVPNRPLTMSDCIALALNESPLLDASRLDVASATEEARAARGQALPDITATGSAEAFSGSPVSKFSIVNEGSTVIAIPTPPPNPNKPPNPNQGGNAGRSVGGAGVETYSAHLSYPLFRDGSILGLNTGPAEASKLARRRNLAWTSKLRREDVIARITDAFISTVSAENREV